MHPLFGVSCHHDGIAYICWFITVCVLRSAPALYCSHDFIHKRINTLRPKQDGCRLPDDIFKCIFFHENILILIKISLKFVPKVRINNIPALVQIMAWRRPGDKPLSWPVMVSLLTPMCVTRPQWVKYGKTSTSDMFYRHFLFAN